MFNEKSLSLSLLTSIDAYELEQQGQWMAKCMTEKEAVRLERKLWGGFSDRALTDLKRIRYSRFATTAAQGRAAWALARWAYSHDLLEEAFQHVVYLRTVDHRRRGTKDAVLLEVELLCRLGMPEEALSVIRDRRGKKPSDLDLILGHANVIHHIAQAWGMQLETERLAIVNSVFEREDLATLRKIDAGSRLSVLNLEATLEAKVERNEEERITVIVPAFNAERTIEIALRSLIRQSWRNLEILVVDDCSADSTKEVVRSIATKDARIHLICHTSNKGAYGARNTGLQHASGEFITIHDSDDWSHPEKLERQAQVLREHGESVATVSHWARVNMDLLFMGQSRPVGKFTEWNHSSLMFCRKVLEAVGRWDEVRVAADTEMVWRLQRIFGPHSVKDVLPGVPLAFALTQEQSLTRSSETHVWTINYGLRREYRAASDYWHRQAKVEDLKLAAGLPRPFPAPLGNLPTRPASLETNILIISDFRRGTGTCIAAMNYVYAAIAAGLRVAVFHWPHYRADVGEALPDEMRGMAHDSLAHIICPGEKVIARDVVVCDPAILDAKPDKPPLVEFERLHVVVSRLPNRKAGGQSIQYDPLACRSNLQQIFGDEGTWAPVSSCVRTAMKQDGRFPKMASSDWPPLLNVDEWTNGLDRRGDKRTNGDSRITIGRHAGDYDFQWPDDTSMLESAYCAHSDYDVRFLGGASLRQRVPGDLPSNWTILEYTSVREEVRRFLNGLDFYVHFAHPECIAEFGQCLAEAMAAHVPVITSADLRSTFGDAALYCDAQNVLSTVRSLWNDTESYVRQANMGFAFVKKTCSYELLAQRLNLRHSVQSKSV